MAYTTWQDVARDLGRAVAEVGDAEREQWAEWIARVESRIMRRIPDVDERAHAENYLATLRGVVVDVVVRRVNNPQGFRTERIDDYYYDRGPQSSDLWLTDDEWQALGSYSSSEAFSTRPGFVPDCWAPREWL